MDSMALVFFVVVGFGFAMQGSSGVQVEVDPREILVLPGQNVTVMCRVAVPLQYCRVQFPDLRSLNLNSKLSHPDVLYYGSGLSAGHCGYIIKNVTERNNGPTTCFLGIETESEEAKGVAQIIVARQPKRPELDLSRGVDSVNVYKINDVLQASCIVRDGRPVANISWYLDDELLYRDGLSMPTVIDLAKENLQSKLQNLTRTLQASDNGKFLRCVAHHAAYPNGMMETRRQLDVKYAPLPQGELDKFGYTIGQEGVISVEIEANPKPIIEWDIGPERIKEGDVDSTGSIEAEAVRELGQGHYQVNLRIARIQKHDTEKIYSLRAYNDMGTQDYNVKISTSPEPEGIELGLGGIVGIIIAIAVVLLVVFLLVFAKLTGRWCFSGPRDSRNLGESSDTESADLRPRDKYFSPIKLTQYFRKNKDKVATEEENEPRKIEDEVKIPLDEDDKPPEVKEGLVYAELDLVSPNVVKPVMKKEDDKTEYAEIVYTPTETENKTTT